MECQQNSNDELISIIKIQDLKIQNLTNHLKNLEQLFHKWQSDALLSKRTSELLAREVDCLKSTPDVLASCSRVSNSQKAKTGAENTEKIKELPTDGLHIEQTEVV